MCYGAHGRFGFDLCSIFAAFFWLKNEWTQLDSFVHCFGTATVVRIMNPVSISLSHSLVLPLLSNQSSFFFFKYAAVARYVQDKLWWVTCSNLFFCQCGRLVGYYRHGIINLWCDFQCVFISFILFVRICVDNERFIVQKFSIYRRICNERTLFAQCKTFVMEIFAGFYYSVNVSTLPSTTRPFDARFFFIYVFEIVLKWLTNRVCAVCERWKLKLMI